MFSYLFSSSPNPPKTIHREAESYIILYTLSQLRQLEPVNWKRNRPPDMLRVQELKEFYTFNNIQIIPGIICGWMPSNRSPLIVYDGIHRYLAATNEMKCIVKIIIAEREQVVLDDFKAVNRSISLPFLYLESNQQAQREVCEYLAQHFCTQYPAFVSTSRRPYRYNFNRDNLIEFFSTLDINFSGEGTKEQLLNALAGLNIQAKQFVKENNIETPRKCGFHKFFLFFLEPAFIKNQLELSLLKNKIL